MTHFMLSFGLVWEFSSSIPSKILYKKTIGYYIAHQKQLQEDRTYHNFSMVSFAKSETHNVVTLKEQVSQYIT